MRLKVIRAVRDIKDVQAIEKVPYEEMVSEESIYKLFQATANQFPHHRAITFLHTAELDETPIQLTYTQLMAKITQAANMFHALGITPDDTISLLLPNMPQGHYLFWGGETAGIINPINFLLNEASILDLLNSAKTKILITLGPHPMMNIWEKVMSIKDQVPSLQAIIQVGGQPVDGEGIYQLDSLMQGYSTEKLTFERHIKKDDIAAYFHTGGTSGTPKLVKQTHGTQIFSAWTSIQMYGYDEQDVIANAVPLFHVSGSLLTGLAPLLAGSEVVILTAGGMRTPAVIKNYWKLVEKYGIKLIGGLPTSLIALNNVPLGEANISTADYCVTGGAMVPQSAVKTFIEKTGVPVGQAFGMTECSGFLTIDPRQGTPKANTEGIRLPFTQLEIRELLADGTIGKQLLPGEVGAICYKGPNCTPGYVKESHNEGTFTEDGFLICGDLGRLDEQGYLTVTGRSKDIIIRSGHNIDPKIIEETAEKHADVLLSAAVARPDDYAGEVVALYVMLKPEGKLTVDDLTKFMKENIAEPPAFPKSIEIISEMPLTGVGKIFKPKLREDQVRQVFDQELQVLRDQGIEIDLKVVEQAVKGMFVSVTLSQTRVTEKENLERMVMELLGKYSIAFTVN
ncbi:MAG: acyl-CoA synthetase [SAR324 cluster bacterium]|uniref:Acyl-CoA synthetase n=1 Tax=SAR324 cluster bacterium TaxID=2024889 RepID=A0A2A4SVH0_9DELT|nr:MAG: acyl-CoA synthetase [SAR324 cluster bacterium]